MDFDHYSNQKRPGFTLKIAKSVWALLGIGIAVAVGAEYCGNKYISRALGQDHPPMCNYTIERGDTLSELLELEGLAGEELEESVMMHAVFNGNKMMPDAAYPTPVFDYISGSPDPDSMRAGGVITVFDYNEDGFIGGQECEPGSF